MREFERFDAKFNDFDNLRRVLPAKLIPALTADAKDLDGLAICGQRIDLLAGETNDRRIKGAAKAALGGANHQQMHLVCTCSGKKLRSARHISDRSCDVAEHLAHTLG